MLRPTAAKAVILLAVTLHTLAAGQAAVWQNMPWNVRQTTAAAGPGNNFWNASSVTFPNGATGPVQLTVRYNGDRWECAELYTNGIVNYGTYVFHVEGRPDTWDRNLVLGMFTYPTNGADGTYEIDIELAKWGAATGNWTNFAVWRNPTPHWLRTYTTALSGTYTTHWFNFQPTGISFGSMHGHQYNLQQPALTYASATMGAADGPRPDLAVPMRLHINLWRFGNAATMAGDLSVKVHRVLFPPTFPRTV